jgi:hypothetical protein
MTGFDGGEESGGKLEIRKTRIAEARIAFVILPLFGAGEPGGRVRQCRGGHAVAFAGGDIKRASGVTIIVTRETLVFTVPRGDFANQVRDGFALGFDRIRLGADASPYLCGASGGQK